MRYAIFTAMGAALAVSACSSDGSSGPSYNQLVDNQLKYAQQLEDTGGIAANATRASQMPRNGSATYRGEGTVILGRDDRPAVAGEATLNADFREGTLRGSVEGFKAASGRSTTGGRLDVAGVIGRDSTNSRNEIRGRVDGDVNVDGRTHYISDTMGGAFTGRNAESVVLGSQGRTSLGTTHSTLITGHR